MFDNMLGLRARSVLLALVLVMCLSVGSYSFSDPAPVYDADSLEQDEGMDSGQTDIPPPPPPGQDGTFVPMQRGPATPSQSVSVESRIRRIEQQINNMQNNDAAAQVESLQTQLQTLRGQVEEISHNMQQMQDQQKMMSNEVDKRLSQLNTPQAQTIAKNQNAANTPPNTSPATAQVKNDKKVADKPVAAPNVSKDGDQPDVAEEQQIYQTAYNLIKARKYNEAVTALQGMLQKYPSGQFASNAHYWLGELYGLMGKNDKALIEFDRVVSSYPDSPRVSDALLKVGLIFTAQSKWVDAKGAFRKVINRYPGTASARLAAEQLKQIRQSGH